MQKFLISIFFILVGLWFFFDGAVRWPRSNVRWLAYEQHEKEGRMAEWPAYAGARGWVTKKPEKYYDKAALAGQYIFGGLAVAAGALLLTYWLTQRNRLLRTDGESVTTPSGKRVPFTAVIGIGKKKWDSKGIATVRYEENGCQRQFIVDDYKFETEPTRQILAELEEHLVARTAKP